MDPEMFDHFDLLAPLFDRTIQNSYQERLVKKLTLPVDGFLLDAGGGTGRVASALSPLVHATFLADSSRGMLLKASGKNLFSIQAVVENLPYSMGVFERIIMVDALHHVRNQSIAISELWRVLSRGGCLVIEEPDIRSWQIKIVAVIEKLALMRSHFLTPQDIANLFPTEAKIRIEVDGYTAWIIAWKT